ncbi:MAG: hypothetical protein K2O88_07180 [Paramuribaculum sp.]|nr:hypothetical protein [Paramuribaculum sp.]
MLTIAASMAACSDNDNEEPQAPGDSDTTPPTEQTTTPITIVEDPTYNTLGTYHGDFNGVGTGNYTVQLVSKGMTWDEDNYTYMGPGEIVYLEFNSTLASNPNQSAISSGTYTIAEDDYSLNTCSGAVTTYSASGDEDFKTISLGNIEVSHNGNLYTITGTVTLSDNSQKTINFNGTLTFLNRSGQGDMSNLESDFTVSGLTKAAAINFGQAFSEESNYCAIMLGDDKFNLDENIGSGSSLNFGINIAPDATTGIPSGKYTVTNCLETESFPVGSAWDGFYYADYAGYYGCWYFFGDYIESALMSGTLDVENHGDGTYTMSFNMADAYGHTVSGTYTGSLFYAYDPE